MYKFAKGRRWVGGHVSLRILSPCNIDRLGEWENNCQLEIRVGNCEIYTYQG